MEHLEHQAMFEDQLDLLDLPVLTEHLALLELLPLPTRHLPTLSLLATTKETPNT